MSITKDDSYDNKTTAYKRNSKTRKGNNQNHSECDTRGKHYLMETTDNSMNEVDITQRNNEMIKVGIKIRMRTSDTKKWKEEMERKETLYISGKWKEEIEEDNYDNIHTSIILFRERTSSLSLNTS